MMSFFKVWINYDKPVSYELQPHSIQVLGNIAVVFYSAKWKGNTVTDYGRYMHTWVKQDNKWKFISGMDASCNKPLECE